jgi:hypothetical protein
VLTLCVTGVLSLAVLTRPASAGPIFTVMNTDETPPDGVWFRNSPHTSDTNRVTGLGVYKNEQVELECYAFGDAVGQYNDSLWYFVVDVTRPTNNGVPNQGYLNAHYIDDGQVANQIDAGVSACGASSPGPSPAPAPAPAPAAAPAPTPAPAPAPAPAVAPSTPTPSPTTTAPSPPPSAPAKVTSTQYVQSAEWLNLPRGETLRIMPTTYARVRSVAAASQVLADALKIAGAPPYNNAVYNNLLVQLQCHLVLALKVPYDLDTWRPSMSLPLEIRHLCNPLP